MGRFAPTPPDQVARRASFTGGLSQQCVGFRSGKITVVPPHQVVLTAVFHDEGGAGLHDAERWSPFNGTKPFCKQ